MDPEDSADIDCSKVIASDLRGTTLQSFWANISFTLTVAVTQPIYSSVSDVFGRKFPLYFSMIFFALGSIVFATAKSMDIVILGRVLQGFGGGGMDVLQVIILSDITTLREKPFYMSVNGVFIAFGAIAGPLVGGVCGQYASWRLLGWINLPIVGLSFVIAVFFLHLKPLATDIRTKFRRLDWVGMLLFLVGSICVTVPLSWADSLYPWLSWKTIVPLMAGLVLFFALAIYEKKPSEPVFPYRILNNITAGAVVISGFVCGLLTYTVLAYLPLFFQAVYLQAPLRAAISTLPICVLVVAFSAISGLVVDYFRQYRLVLWLGWLSSTAFLGLFCLLNRFSSAEAYAFQAIAGTGIGTIITVTAIPMQASVEKVDDAGLAAGIYLTSRLFGALVGLAIGSTAFSSVFQNHITALGMLPKSAELLMDARNAVNFIPTLRTLVLPIDTMEAIIQVYQQSFKTIWIILASLSGVGLLTSLFIKELTLEKDDVGRQGFQQPV